MIYVLKKEAGMLWRHGDVLIAASAEGVPGVAERRPGQVLAWGEVTGHSHRVAEAGAAEVWEARGALWLKITAASATVVHEEHRALTLPRGVYRVWTQREYSPSRIVPVRD
jgi:hypothetical protein